MYVQSTQWNKCGRSIPTYCYVHKSYFSKVDDILKEQTLKASCKRNRGGLNDGWVLFDLPCVSCCLLCFLITFKRLANDSTIRLCRVYICEYCKYSQYKYSTKMESYISLSKLFKMKGYLKDKNTQLKVFWFTHVIIGVDNYVSKK